MDAIKPAFQPNHQPIERMPAKKNRKLAPSKSLPRYIVLDVEVQRSAQEVGGWAPENVAKTGLACAVTYSYPDGQIRLFDESSVKQLVAHLKAADLVVGYNLIRWDLNVLRGYKNVNLKKLTKVIDLWLELSYSLIKNAPNLDELYQANFGEEGGPSGFDLLKLWKQGDKLAVVEACINDVLRMQRLFQRANEKEWLYVGTSERRRRVTLTRFPKIKAGVFKFKSNRDC